METVKNAMKWLARLLGILVLVVLVVGLVIRLLFGGGRRLEDRTADARLPGSVLEVMADLDYPPGNIAVPNDGRVFVTLHPDGKPALKVLELVDGEPMPYPSVQFQQPSAGTPHFQSVLSLRTDRQNRLWVLDYANFGTGQPRLLVFDLATDELVHQYDFPSAVAGFLSMLNDFQIAPDGDKIYIAATSPFLQTPAIIVYDTKTQTSRRLLEGYPSVIAEDYIIQAPGRDMTLFGIYDMRIGIDSLALDPQGQWLYYGPMSGDRMYRIATEALNDESLAADALATKVEDFGPKTLSDGLTMDLEDNIYISDIEHSAILTLGPDGTLTTLVRDPRLRWPDGFSFGPGGWLYVTCSSLENVLFVSDTHMHAHAPYQIFRFRPGPLGVPGH